MIPTLSIEAVHHTADKFELILEREIDEIGVNENPVWRNKGGVVSEEQRRGNWSSTQAER